MELADYESLGVAGHFGTLASYLLGLPADLETHARHLQTAALAVSQPFMSYVDTCVTQGQAYLRGDFAKAERLAKTALEIGEMNLGSSEGPHGVQMFMTRRETGGLDKVRAFITGQESFTGRWLPGMLALYTELGLADGMRRALQGLLNQSRLADALWPIELAFMADAAADLADEEAARVLTPHLARYAGMNIAAAHSSPPSAVPTGSWPASPSCPAPTPGLTSSSSPRWRSTSAWGRSCTSPRRWPGTRSPSIAAGTSPLGPKTSLGRPRR